MEVCYDPDTGHYTVDGSPYAGDPYEDLVVYPEDLPVEDPYEATYSNNGYIFYSDGFCLRDFQTNLAGGRLLFRIMKPDNSIITTYALYESGIRSYGDGKCYKISTPYHNLA